MVSPETCRRSWWDRNFGPTALFASLEGPRNPAVSQRERQARTSDVSPLLTLYLLVRPPHPSADDGQAEAQLLRDHLQALWVAAAEGTTKSGRQVQTEAIAAGETYGRHCFHDDSCRRATFQGTIASARRVFG